MSYTLNTTNNYHINELNSLGWEMTVCNALYPATSPCRKALQSNNSFGVLLYQFLEKLFPLNQVSNVLEIGGGLGNLMHDFLMLKPQIKATMIDISPHLLAKQKELLHRYAVDFREMDILQIDVGELSQFDLVIMNENLGDLPTLVADSAHKSLPEDGISSFHRAGYFIDKYQLPVAQNENINIGAWEILEKLCLAGIKYIYLSEHSCEAAAPDHLKSYLRFTALGNPKKIALKGHDEYTIKFSCLQKIAQKFDYNVVRGLFADFVKPDFNDQVRAALRLQTPHTGEQEILQHFVYDLYKYEYLVLTKGDK
ncbi:MAG: class I SAM-dependent methyltransferase [Smithella sp.]